MKAQKSNFGVMGWLLIFYMAMTFFIVGQGGSIQNITAGIFEQMYGWDQAFIISLNSIGGWISAVFILLIGAVVARGAISLNKIIAVCGIGIGICYMVMGNTSSIAVYAILFCVYYVGYVLWAQLANQALCNNWFPRKKGVAIGWATMGFPLSSSIGLVLFSVIMGKIGINKAYIVLGVVAIIIGVAGALVFPDFPEKRGFFPDNDKTMTREQANKELEEGQALVAKSPWTFKRLVSTKEVWLAFIPCGLVGFFAVGSISQVVPRLMAAGYSADAATGMISACALIAVPGSFIIGWVDSKFGTKRSFIFSMVLVIIGSVLYAIETPVTIWIALVIIGVALGGSSNFAMSMTTTYFGRYHFQKAFGVTLFITMLVSNTGAMYVAQVAAKWSYPVAYLSMVVMAIIGILMILPVKDNFAEKYEAKFAAEDAAKK